MTFNPQGLPSAVWNMPHTHPPDACNIIPNAIPKIPIWPQLPNMNIREETAIRYSEGIPYVEREWMIFWDTPAKNSPRRWLYLLSFRKNS
jgi:hypothetical protein